MKRIWLILSCATLFLITTLSWAYYVVAQSVTLSVMKASNLPRGEIADIIPYTGSQTVSVSNKPNEATGLELYQVNLGNLSFSNNIHIQLFWTNPQNAESVLHKGWIQVGVYYPNSNGSYLLPDGVTKVSLDSSTLTALNPQNADTVLSPKVANQTTLYIIASIMNSANHIPPGQQVNGELQFYAQVRK